ncbi:MAG TPA: tRNA dihydrouridine(20/20a) synthase DusA, partial [Chromatiaceae bacterium]|nr:tRNA dihydrouridine(20/20a) synthase DusA [Chromatiaceae bacterium]
RKAWLQGLSPRENRRVPPLRYDMVERLKQDHPWLNIVLNGGIVDLVQAERHLQWADGVMIGRAVYHNPYLLAEADARLYNDHRPIISREHLLEAYLPYVEQRLAEGVRLHSMTRHLLGLYHGQPGARRWRQHLSTRACQGDAGVEVLNAWLTRA